VMKRAPPLLPPSLATQVGEVDRDEVARRRGSIVSLRLGRQRLRDRLQHAVEVGVNPRIPEPHNRPSAAFKRLTPPLIVPAFVGSRVRPTIKLDGKAQRHNCKVHDVRADRMLRAKSPPAQLPSPDAGPKYSLSIGEVPPQGLRTGSRLPILLHRETPSVSPRCGDPPPPVCRWWRQEFKARSFV
jgi:hypothetical protein